MRDISKKYSMLACTPMLVIVSLVGLSAPAMAQSSTICSVDYLVSEVDETSIFGEVIITNLSTTAITGYELSWMQPGTVAGVWGGAFVPRDEGFFVSNDATAEKGVIEAGESVRLAVQAIDLDASLDIATEFYLNGEPCDTRVETRNFTPGSFMSGVMGDRYCPTSTATLTTGASGYTGSSYFEFGDAGQPRLDLPNWSNTASDLGSTVVVRIRYANGSSESLTMNAYGKRGIAAETLEFPPTGGWSEWREVALTGDYGQSVDLSLVGVEGQVLPHIDSVTVSWLQECPWSCQSGGISYAPGPTEGVYCPGPVPELATDSNLAPVAEIGIANSSLPGPFSVMFYSNNSYDPEGTPVESFWDFGDGTTGSGDIVDHTYLAPGVYTITLTVSDGELDDTTSLQYTVESPESSGPGCPKRWKGKKRLRMGNQTR